MKKIITGILCMVAVCFSQKSFSQQAVCGKVTDLLTGEPIEFAVITFRGSNTEFMTDNAGRFKLIFTGDSAHFKINMIGYREKKCDIGSAGELPVIALEHGIIDLSKVTVTAPSNNAGFHTISSIDMNLRPVNSSQDLMRLVPGLFLGQHQGGGIAEHIFFRGFDADHGTDVNVSVDGMPLNLVSHAHGQGFSDLHFLIPELVRKYEFGKGPYYADHGDFTTAGYISFQTKDVLDHSMIKIEGGQYHSGRVVALINLLSDKARKKGESAYIAGEAAYTDGAFDLAQHFSRENIFGKYNVNLSPKSKLKITLSHFNSAWRSSGEVPERAVDDGEIDRFGYIDSAQGGRTHRTTAIAGISTSLSDHLTLENKIYYTHYFFNLNYDPTLFVDDSINGDQLRQRESRDLFGYNGKLTAHTRLKNGADLSSSFGAGWQLNNIHNSELSHTINKNTVLEYIQLGDIKESTLNGYVDENYHTGKWLFNAGLRFDYLRFNYLDKLNEPAPVKSRIIGSPKINISYTLNKKTEVYAKAGKGFHSNDAKVVAANNGIEILPAAYGTDIGINWKPVPHLFINAAAWYLHLQQEFVYDADEGTFEPGNKTKREGVDLSLRYQFTHWLYANFDMNYCKARNMAALKGENYLPLAVPLSSTGGLDFKFTNGINGGFSYRYMKDRPANEGNSLVAKGYFVSDLTANYTTKKYEVGLEIQNLFNTKWREAQFAVESRLRNEAAAVEDISFTPGTPFFAKLKLAVFFK